MRKAGLLSIPMQCLFFHLLLPLAALRYGLAYSPTNFVTTGLSQLSRKQFGCKVSGFGNMKPAKNEERSFAGIDSKRFSSYLPKPDDEGPSSTVQSRVDSWILLVDDEEPIRTAVGDFFVDQGYRVTTCGDGAQALELLSQQVPDCIVSDIRMPNMDGLELLGVIRSSSDDELVNVPVVLLSARALVQDRIAGYDAGTDAYLTKPFSPYELVAIVDNLLERSKNLKLEYEDLHKPVTTQDLQKDLVEIKKLLQTGGAGIGNGWVQKTDIFLSKDERAVLEFLSKGLKTKEIAFETHLSTRRIEQLLTGMFRKTGVKNRTELVKWAVSTGNVE